MHWVLSGEAWFRVFLKRDIFNGTASFADAKLSIIWRSAKPSLATTAITFGLGPPTTWRFATRPANWRAFWLFLIPIPFWSHLPIRTFAIMEVIRNQGLINPILIHFAPPAEPIQILCTDTAMLIGMAFVDLPLMVLPLDAAIDRFDIKPIEAGYDFYASQWQILGRIILPIIRPGIVAGAILAFTRASSGEDSHRR